MTKKHRDDFTKILRGSDMSEQDVLRLIDNYNKELPSLVRTEGTCEASLFNGLALACFTRHPEVAALGASLDTHSLLRLALNLGGRTISIPTFEHVIMDYTLLLAVYAVRMGRMNLYRVYGLLKKFLLRLGLAPVPYKEFRDCVTEFTDDVLRSLSITEIRSKPLLDALQDEFERLADLHVQYTDKLAETTDPDVMLAVYQELTSTVSGVQSFLLGAITDHATSAT